MSVRVRPGSPIFKGSTMKIIIALIIGALFYVSAIGYFVLATFLINSNIHPAVDMAILAAYHFVWFMIGYMYCYFYNT